MHASLDTLAIPPAPMPSHALRSTFISIALEDGADDRMIERVKKKSGPEDCTRSPGPVRRTLVRRVPGSRVNGSYQCLVLRTRDMRLVQGVANWRPLLELHQHLGQDHWRER
jgi:hypothetical protein